MMVKAEGYNWILSVVVKAPENLNYVALTEQEQETENGGAVGEHICVFPTI